jgi:hypothetical protein
MIHRNRNSFHIPSTILAFALACLLAFAFPGIPGAFAAEKETAQDKAAADLVERGIFQGDAKGNLNLDLSLTRAEMAVLLARLSGDEEQWLKDNSFRRELEKYFDANVLFRDVPPWAKLHIAASHRKGLIKGYDKYMYGSMGDVDAKAVCTLALRYLGYEEGDKWDYNSSIDVADSLKLLPDGGFESESEILRGDVAVVVYNAIQIKESGKLPEIKKAKPVAPTQEV